MNRKKEEIFVFNETVRGSLHIEKGIPCEDASASYSSDDGTINIIIVADGHGSERYSKSKEGSRLAVEVTMNILKNFAEEYFYYQDAEDSSYSEFLDNPRTQKQIIRQITDSIIANWYDSVVKNYQEFEEEELSEKEIPILYGTTLIAALMLPEFVLFLHQGDGRCVVFYEDGTVNQPIPWDERCVGNVTTSLCDSDAAQKIRTLVLDRNQDKVAAIFLASDGVDDTFGDSESTGEGINTFYKNLILEIHNLGNDEFRDYLPQYLTDFSRNGDIVNSFSGDDVSISAIVKNDKIEPYLDDFENDIHNYQSNDKLVQYQSKLNSMEQKHDILKKRWQQEEDLYLDSLVQKNSLEKLKNKVSDEIHEIEDEIIEKRTKLTEYADEDFIDKIGWQLNLYEPLKQFAYELFEKQSSIHKGFTSVIENEVRMIKKSLKKLENDLLKKNQECLDIEDSIMKKKKDMEEHLEKCEQLKLEYKQYDENYSEVQERIVDLEGELQFNDPD